MHNLTVMKNIALVTLIICLACAQLTCAQITISWPVDKTVYQRPNNGNGSVSFTVGGQCVVSNSNYQLQYRISRLSVQSGTTTSIYTDWSTFAYSRPYGGIFNLPVTLSCGWYSIEIRALLSGSSSTYYPQGGIKVGIGDVLVVAGQSNAQGVVSTPSYSESPYDGVVADFQTEDCSTDIPKFPQITSLYQDNKIAPQGPTNWAYTVMGNRLATQTGCPVSVFNAARFATTVKNWEDSKNGGPATNVYNSSQLICNQSGMPYTGLKNALNYYGSLFGVRAVLWHQGETDNQQGTSDIEYSARLNNVIGQTRTDFNGSLSWYIARASYNPEVLGLSGRSTPYWQPVISGQTNVANSNNYGPNTDNIGIPRNGDPNEVHFGGTQLKDLGEAWKNSNLTSAAPVGPNSGAATISVNNNNGTYTLTANAPSGFNQIFWVNNSNRVSSYFSTNSSISVSNGNYRFYAKNGQGNYVVSPRVDIPLPAGSARVGTVEQNDEYYGYSLNVTPNPVDESTSVQLKCSTNGPIMIDIVDDQGKQVQLITNQLYEAGTYTFTLNTSQLKDGIYICRMKANDFFLSKKFVKLNKY